MVVWDFVNIAPRYVVTVVESVGECQGTASTKKPRESHTVCFRQTLDLGLTGKTNSLYVGRRSPARFTRRPRNDFFAKAIAKSTRRVDACGDFLSRYVWGSCRRFCSGPAAETPAPLILRSMPEKPQPRFHTRRAPPALRIKSGPDRSGSRRSRTTGSSMTRLHFQRVTVSLQK